MDELSQEGCQETNVIPMLGGDHYALIRAKMSTGELLNVDGTVYFGGANHYESIVELSQARRRAQVIIDRERGMEVSIFDGNACFVEIFRQEG